MMKMAKTVGVVTGMMVAGTTALMVAGTRAKKMAKKSMKEAGEAMESGGKKLAHFAIKWK